jgi:hypothetical protein
MPASLLQLCCPDDGEDEDEDKPPASYCDDCVRTNRSCLVKWHGQIYPAVSYLHPLPIILREELCGIVLCWWCKKTLKCSIGSNPARQVPRGMSSGYSESPSAPSSRGRTRAIVPFAGPGYSLPPQPQGILSKDFRWERERDDRCKVSPGLTQKYITSPLIRSLRTGRRHRQAAVAHG